MNLEQQVCSLDLAKRLKELGVKQESLFYWEAVTDQYNVEPELKRTYKVIPENKEGYYGMGDKWKSECFAAFTVAELGEMLPGNIGGLYFRHQWGFMHKRAYTWAIKMEDNNAVMEFDEKSEADARAKMLIYLLENNLLATQPNSTQPLNTKSETS